MRLIDPTILAALGARELKPFQLLELALPGGTLRYTDCDVPIGTQLARQVVSVDYTNHGLSFADGCAFARLNGMPLAPYAGAGFLITLIDSAGKQAAGYIGSADAAEEVDSNTLLNPGLETLTTGTPDDGASDNFTSWTEGAVDDGAGNKVEQVTDERTGGAGTKSAKLSRGTGSTYAFQARAVTPGRLYRVGCWTKGDGTNSGRFRVRDVILDLFLVPVTTLGVSAAAWTQAVCGYFTASAAATSLGVYFYSPVTNGSFANFDDVALEPVDHVGTDGVHIVSAQGGTTRNWTSIETGFNYNDSQYTAIISDARFEPRGFSHDGARYSLGRIVDRVSLELDNVDETLSAEFIGGDPQGAAVSLKEIVLDSNNQVMGRPVTWFSGTIDDYDAEEGRIRMSVVGPNYAWSRKTTSRHPSSCRWRVFKGAECEFAGDDSFCDRSYARCASLANTDNFGGFRWLPSIENREIVWGRKA